MPPRKSTARNASSTPARSTRAASSTARNTRATPGPSSADLANPQLPEVQTQQSFAYGSTTTPLLPKALKIPSRMTTAEMAQTLDEEIDQAEANLRAHVAEATSYGRDIAAERAERARRRSESRDSREGSITSEATSAAPRGRRGRTPSQQSNATGTLDDDTRNAPRTPPTLGVIDEVIDEGSIHTSDVDDEGTPNVPDWTYNLEEQFHNTGIFGNAPPPFRPILEHRQVNRNTWTDQMIVIYAAITRFFGWFRIIFSNIFILPVIHTYHEICQLLREEGQSIRKFITQLCLLSLKATAVALLAIVFLRGFGVALPIHYDTSAIHNITRLFTPYNAPPAVIDIDHASASHIQGIISMQDARLRELEYYAKDNMKKANELIREQENNANWLKGANRLVDTIVASKVHSALHEQPSSLPEIPRYSTRINYMSPGTGAVVDPYLTSPTKQKHFTWTQRMLLAPFGGLSKYQSRPPVEALMAWQEQGECWCSAAPSDSTTSYTQLVVLLGHTIYPEELVIEHPYSSASTDPRTAPKHIELWAFDEVSFRQDVTDSDAGVLGKGWRPVGQDFEYRAPTDVKPGAPGNVQAFKLPVLIRPTNKLAVRVLDNHGADNTCMYRVRVHGTPKDPHAVIKEDD